MRILSYRVLLTLWHLVIVASNKKNIVQKKKSVCNIVLLLLSVYVVDLLIMIMRMNYEYWYANE